MNTRPDLEHPDILPDTESTEAEIARLRIENRHLKYELQQLDKAYTRLKNSGLKLSMREKDVIDALILQKLSLSKTGELFDIGRERVRKIRDKVLHKLVMTYYFDDSAK